MNKKRTLQTNNDSNSIFFSCSFFLRNVILPYKVGCAYVCGTKVRTHTFIENLSDEVRFGFHVCIHTNALLGMFSFVVVAVVVDVIILSRFHFADSPFYLSNDKGGCCYFLLLLFSQTTVFYVEIHILHRIIRINHIVFQ